MKKEEKKEKHTSETDLRFKSYTFTYQLDCRAFSIANQLDWGWGLCKCSFVETKGKIETVGEEERRVVGGKERGSFLTGVHKFNSA